jgi:hypothetical protein
MTILVNSTIYRSYSTSFTATENPLSEGGRWVCGGTVGLDWTDPQTNGALCFPTQTQHAHPPFDDSVAMLAGRWPTDVTITTTIGKTGTPTGLHEVEHFHRMTVVSNSVKGYEVDIDLSGNLFVVLWRGPINSFINAGTVAGNNVADGATWSSSMSGSVLTVRNNGSQVFSQDMSAWSTTNGETYLANGNPGIGFWYDATDAKSNYGWTNYSVTS